MDRPEKQQEGDRMALKETVTRKRVRQTEPKATSHLGLALQTKGKQRKKEQNETTFYLDPSENSDSFSKIQVSERGSRTPMVYAGRRGMCPTV